MKVLHVLGSIERSGAETMLRASASGFSDIGISLEAVATGERVGEYAGAFERASITVHHVPFARSLSFFAEFARLIREGAYDVVHVHTERAAVWVELTARLAGAPCIVRSVHSSFEFEGWLRVRRAFGRWFAAHALRVTHVFVSDSVAANEVARFGTIGVIVANGIDQDAFVPVGNVELRNRLRAELGVPRDAVVVLSVGRCIELKQHDHILCAMEGLLSVLPTLFYVHVGSGENLDEEYALASRLGVLERSLFVGQCDDVVRILQMSDIFLMPSAYEGMGIAAVEASSCGLPVIAYDVPGLRDAVSDGHTGLLVKPNPSALGRAIRCLAVDAATRTEYGLAGRTMVLQRFSLSQWVGSLASLYGRILDR